MFNHLREIRRAVDSENIVLSLSLGKDSVASLILLSMVFKNVYCIVGEQLPNRKRDREYAKYLQKRFPCIKKINFYPHPRFIDRINNEGFFKPDQLHDPFYLSGGEPEKDLYGYD